MLNRKHITIAFLFFIFTSCLNELKTTFSEINITTPNNTIVEVNIPNATGNKEIVNQINSEIQKAVIATLHVGEPHEMTSNSIEESITSFNDEFKSFQSDFPYSEQIWEAQIDGDIMYQSTEIISIAITSYVNTGGAHGILNIALLNFDAINGQPFKNKTLFKDIEAFKSIAQVHFEEATKDKDIFLESNSFELPENIGYSEEGIVLLYNTYEMAPYASGIIQFTIPFKEVANYLVFNSL